MSSLKIAVIGFGLIGKKHAEIIDSNKDVTLSAIVEPDQSLRKDINFKCKIFNSIEELLKLDKPDGVVIATPTPLQLDHAKKFVLRNIPVLIEKPIGNKVSVVEKFLSYSDKKSVPILVGHHRRYNNIISTAKKTIDSNLIGKIRSVISTCWFYKPDHYFDKAPWRKKTGAGPVSVNLIHDVDLLIFFCGEISSVQAITVPSFRGYENEDLASVIFEFKSGAIGNMSVSDSIVSPWSWEMTSKENSDFPFTAQNCYLIGGSEGSLSIPDLNLWKHKDNQDWLNSFKNKKLKFRYNDPFKQQLVHFSNVIKKKEEPKVSGYDGLNALKVVEAIQNSANKKKIIHI
ncbi:MAG: Gfo/Idh/MocA family oxidoreductase [Pelagibacteraceae bacterium]